jgi:LuxR family maltose regulon positive regulatory protein
VEEAPVVIETLALLALAKRGLGKARQAFEVIVACLSLAESEGYVRVFLDEGEPMRELLEAAGSQLGAEHPLAAYLERLRSAYPPRQLLQF